MNSKIRKQLPILLLIINLFIISNCARIKTKGETENFETPNWTMFGRDPQRTNNYPNSIKLPLKLVWMKKAPAAITPSIILVDSIIYCCTMDGRLNAYHLTLGNNMGYKKFNYEPTCVYDDNNLYIARRYGDNTLYKYSLERSKYLWEINAGDISSEPLISSKGIIVTALYKHIDKYNLIDGKKIWTFETKDQIRSSPAIAQGIIIFGCDDGNIYAVKESTGKLQWQYKTQASVQSTPSIDLISKIAFVGSSDYNLYALNLDTGDLQWEFKTQGQLLNGIAQTDGSIIFGSTDNHLYCLNKNSGELIWKYKANSVVSTSPVVADSVVFWGALDNFYYAANVKDGKLLWKYEAKGRIRTNPIIWGDYFIGASEDNYLYAFKYQEEQLEE